MQRCEQDEDYAQGFKAEREIKFLCTKQADAKLLQC